MYAHCVAQFQFASVGTSAWQGTYGIPLPGIEPGPFWYPYPARRRLQRDLVVQHARAHVPGPALRLQHLGVRAHVPRAVLPARRLASSSSSPRRSCRSCWRSSTPSPHNLNNIRDSLVIAATTRSSRRRRLAIGYLAVIVVHPLLRHLHRRAVGLLLHLAAAPHLREDRRRHGPNHVGLGHRARPRRAADLLEGHQGRVEGRLGRHLVRPGRALWSCSSCSSCCRSPRPRSPATSTSRQQRHGRSHHRRPRSRRPPSSCTTSAVPRLQKVSFPVMAIGILIAIVGQSISGARFGMAWAEGVVAQEVDHEGNRSSTRSSSRSRCTTRPSQPWPSSSRWGSSLPWSMQRHLVNGVGCFAAGLFCGWVILVHPLLPARS